MSKAKIFGVLDAKCGFWQVKLDDKSNFLTTFNIQYGRYPWMQMPFGISCMLEVWQQRMNHIIKGFYLQ